MLNELIPNTWDDLDLYGHGSLNVTTLTFLGHMTSSAT